MVWKTKQQEAFEAAKCLLSQDTALAHCDLKRALKLYCDASAYGLGVCLVHIMDDNSEKQVAYALCTLTKSEMAYAQIERKGLVLVHIWHLPLAWMPFCISVTVHRPLSVRYVFVSKDSAPTMATCSSYAKINVFEKTTTCIYHEYND